MSKPPFYREPLFLVALAAVSIVIIIVVVAILCVKSKSYKYKGKWKWSVNLFIHFGKSMFITKFSIESIRSQILTSNFYSYILLDHYHFYAQWISKSYQKIFALRKWNNRSINILWLTFWFHLLQLKRKILQWIKTILFLSINSSASYSP